MIGIEIVCFVKKMTFCAALSEPPIEITGRVPGQAGGWGSAPAALDTDRTTDADMGRTWARLSLSVHRVGLGNSPVPDVDDWTGRGGCK